MRKPVRPAPAVERNEPAPPPWTRPPGVPALALPGLVTRAHGKFFDVSLRDEERVLLATVRGSLRRERQRTDLVAVGDRVWVVDVGEGEGQIEGVEPRQRVLARLARHTRDTEQVLLANPDQALFLMAVRNPEPHPRALDRWLVLAESRGLPAIIGINKIDLDDAELSRAKSLFGPYESIYPVIYLSVREGTGLDRLRELLDHRISVVAGPSGAGKSSLLNALDRSEQRDVGSISEATGKGRHVTTGTRLSIVAPGTYVADTAGVRSILFQGVEPEALPGYFPEFRPFLGACLFADCTHVNEAGCAVLAAVETGAIGRERHESYSRLRRGDAGEREE